MNKINIKKEYGDCSDVFYNIINYHIINKIYDYILCKTERKYCLLLWRNLNINM